MGLLIHLLLDLGPNLPLFWPFISYDFIINDDPIGDWITTLFTNPLVLTTEIIGLGSLLFIIYNNKLYGITLIINFLRTNNQNRIEKTNN